MTKTKALQNIGTLEVKAAVKGAKNKMKDKSRVLINIPADGNYIEILGYRIDGFKSFEAFCEHLKKYAELEEEICRLKDEREGLIIGQITLQKALARAEAKVESKSAVMETMARCIEIQEKEIERLKKLLAESEAKYNEAAKRFYKEGVRAFQEKLKDNMNNVAKVEIGERSYYLIGLDFVNTIAKDLTGETE